MTSIDRANFVNRIATIVFYIVAGCFFLLLACMTGFSLYNGFGGGNLRLLSPEGIGAQLFNTIYLVVLALLISMPIGILAGIYMAMYAKPGNFTKFIRISIETLSSLPSIVIGLFGYLVFILLTGAKWNLFAGALTVSILMLPVLTTITEDALRSLPDSYAKASYGLGATKFQTIRNVLLPACIPQIITGIILAAGRAFGEAAALLYTAGMATDINWASTNLASPTNPWNPFRPGETLALQIWASRTEALHADASAMADLSAAVLMVLICTFTIVARYLSRRWQNRMMGR